MPLTDMIPLAGMLCAPAFFILFALAALGAPLVALACFAAGEIRRTQHPEAYARRVLRMAFTCAVPSLLVFIGTAAVAGYRTPWLADWARAEPIGTGLLAMGALAYSALLMSLRKTGRSPNRNRSPNPVGQTFILTIFSAVLVWLALSLAWQLQLQAQAVLSAPGEDGLSVVRLITLDLSRVPPLIWPSLAAAIPLCTACAGAISLEYLLLLRDHEPFGREALAHMLRLGARVTLRSGILSGAFLPFLWMHLPQQTTMPELTQPIRLLLMFCGACCVLFCLSAGSIARSPRPANRALLMHANLLLLWMALTALLATGLFCFYGQ